MKCNVKNATKFMIFGPIWPKKKKKLNLPNAPVVIQKARLKFLVVPR